MRIIDASDFEAECLAILDEIAETNETLVITRNGRPVCRLVPYEARRTTLFGLHQREIVMHDDLVEESEGDWDVTR